MADHNENRSVYDVVDMGPRRSVDPPSSSFLVEMADTLADLPRILHAARISRGLTYRQAAEQIGTTPSHLCNLERGRVGWGTDLSVRILRWLGAPRSDSRPYDVPSDCEVCDGWHPDGECPPPPPGRRGRDVKRVEEMFTEEEEKALRQDLHRIHRTAYPEWDLPGMWEQADLTGGWTDCEPPPSGSTSQGRQSDG